jgi:CRP/FNR family transcriptional regulator
MTQAREATGWLQHFPALQTIEDPEGLAVLRTANEIRVPSDTTVFHSGDACQNYLLVIEGSVRVQQVSTSGREIVLYRVGPGQSCVLTTTCLLATERYVAEGITETPVHAIAIPAAQFQRGVNASAGFRRFVFAAFGQRLSSLMQLVEEVAFGKLDARLAKRLLTLSDGHPRLAMTHQELAIELGTAREVVSRMLKEFEKQGWVRLQRGILEILDRQALQHLAYG